MHWENIDWKALARLRTAFLDGTAGATDYWHNERVLENYDQTFGQRIRWKWDYVLKELKASDWLPPRGEIVDWGCGTGVATRALVTHCEFDASSRIILWDRSPTAMRYAAHKLRELLPTVNMWLEKPAECPFGTLLLSHVLTELTDTQVDELLPLMACAMVVIWIEPGTYEASRRLIAVRERLRDVFHVVAPCTHRAACGMLTPANERHWCHHFAPSPPEVFTNGHWAKFAKLAGVDLRSLPLSFLVLDKRPQVYPDELRVIGRPRVYKAHALVLGCESNGVQEHRHTKRDEADLFRRLKKGEVPHFLPTRGEA